MSGSCTVLRMLLVLLLTIGTTGYAQTVDQQRAGVVRVTAVLNKVTKTGTGFIVRLDADAAYILTAAHVVEGDPRPRVEFYTRQTSLVEVDATRLEGGDPRGLALLIVRGKEKLPSGLSALPLADGSNLTGGEPVVTIGFPQGAGPWAVVPATVVSRMGRDITLAGAIDEGNSGGPVLSNGAVVAVVVQQSGKFGVAVPVVIAKMTIEGWGMKPVPSQAQSTDAGAVVFTKPTPPASRDAASSDGEAKPAETQSGPPPPNSSPASLESALPLPGLVRVPGGEFQMGEAGQEEPVHRVTIARPFYLAKTEITFAQYDAFCKATKRTCPADKGWGRGNRPVINVSWSDAQAYAEWLSAMTGVSCRLPTEAEWEYAARAGTTTKYPWGDEPGTGKGNFNRSGAQWSGYQTALVGSFPPNAWGLHDMNGNVWEWTCSAWRERFDGSEQQCVEEKDAVARVVRGGSWNYGPDYARSAARYRNSPVSRSSNLGFRVLCSSPIE